MNYLQYMLARIRWFWLAADVEPALVAQSAVSLGWSLTLAINGPVIQQEPALVGVFQLASHTTWSVVFGIVALFNLHTFFWRRGHWLLSVFGSLITLCVWTVVCLSYFHHSFIHAEHIIYYFLWVSVIWTFLRSGDR